MRVLPHQRKVLLYLSLCRITFIYLFWQNSIRSGGIKYVRICFFLGYELISGGKIRIVIDAHFASSFSRYRAWQEVSHCRYYNVTRAAAPCTIIIRSLVLLIICSLWDAFVRGIGATKSRITATKVTTSHRRSCRAKALMRSVRGTAASRLIKKKIFFFSFIILRFNIVTTLRLPLKGLVIDQSNVRNFFYNFLLLLLLFFVFSDGVHPHPELELSYSHRRLTICKQLLPD